MKTISNFNRKIVSLLICFTYILFELSQGERLIHGARSNSAVSTLSNANEFALPYREHITPCFCCCCIQHSCESVCDANLVRTIMKNNHSMLGHRKHKRETLSKTFPSGLIAWLVLPQTRLFNARSGASLQYLIRRNFSLCLWRLQRRYHRLVSVFFAAAVGSSVVAADDEAGLSTLEVATFVSGPNSEAAQFHRSLVEQLSRKAYWYSQMAQKSGWDQMKHQSNIHETKRHRLSKDQIYTFEEKNRKLELLSQC